MSKKKKKKKKNPWSNPDQLPIALHQNIKTELPAEQTKPTQAWAAENADLSQRVLT